MKLKYNDFARGHASEEILDEAHGLKDAISRLRPILDIRSNDGYAAFVSGGSLSALHDRIMDTLPPLRPDRMLRLSTEVTTLLDSVSLAHGEKFLEHKVAAQKRGRETIPQRDRSFLKGELRSALREVVGHIVLLHEAVREASPLKPRFVLTYNRH